MSIWYAFAFLASGICCGFSLVNKWPWQAAWWGFAAGINFQALIWSLR